MKLSFTNTKEQNELVLKEALTQNDEYLKLKEGISRNVGLDITDEKAFPVLERKFSWKKLETKLEEAEAASSFVQVLRAGVQNVVNSMYETVPVSYTDWAHVVQSSKDTELYAPLHGLAFPREVPRQGIYPESRSAGLDIKLTNRKYGTLFAVEQELLEDDQTGQFQKQAGLLGEYMKLLTEVLVYGKLASVANMQYIDFTIPVSETKPSDESNYPYTTSAAPFVGGGYNRPVSFGALTQANLQDGFIALMNQKNLLGIKMQVDPDTIVASPRYKFDLQTILNSNWYPGSAPSGFGSFIDSNPMKGIAKPVFSRYLPNQSGSFDTNTTRWWILDSKKPFFVLQMREPASVLQEAANAGQSFERDIIRFKVRSRMNADFVDPRFLWLGNDGSV